MERFGAISEDRSVTVEGRQYAASEWPSERTRLFFTGGVVAGRPVPRGWYSEPWWAPALDTGTWSTGGYLIGSALLFQMPGVGWSGEYQEGYYADHADENGGKIEHDGAVNSGQDGGDSRQTGGIAPGEGDFGSVATDF